MLHTSEDPPGRHAMNFTVGEHSARHLRRIVRMYLRSWSMSGATGAVELALTELLANVVRHVPDRRCALLFVRQGGTVRVEVTDGARGWPCVRVGRGLAEGGWGLALVEAVTDRWGVVPLAGGGKTVWFECDAKVE